MRASSSALESKTRNRINEIIDQSKTKFRKLPKEEGVRKSQFQTIQAKFKRYGPIDVSYHGTYALITYKILKGYDKTAYSKNPIVEEVTEKVTLNSIEKLGEAIVDKVTKPNPKKPKVEQDE